MRRVLCLLLLLAACQTGPSTQIVVDVAFEDAWALTRFSYDLAARHATSAAARRVTVIVPAELAGQTVELGLWGLRGNTRYAHGVVSVATVRDQAVHAELLMTRVPCGAWCTAGTTACQGDATVVCEQRDDDQCFEWSTATACPADAPYCSLGTCRADCIDECASGETRCDGPGGVRVCGQADNDDCNDWLPAVACADGELCAGGACTASCQDECQAGEHRCEAGGTVTCGDLDGNGCLEWGPAMPCPAGQSCSGGQCATSCSDECSESVCQGSTARACGQFDLDSCKDLSPGTSCIPADPCLEGACTGGTCSSAPRVCDQPPDPICLDADTRRVYQSQGTCSADGSCTYAHEDRDCPACPACDPCLGVTCNHPPEPVTCYLAAGTCGSDGACDYAYADDASCDDGNACTTGDRCDTGVCSGTPRTCNTPPDPECVSASTLRTYAGSGTCSGGSCSYGHTDSTCALGCTSGACRGWKAVSAGGDHTCALRLDGSLECWGLNEYGEASAPPGVFVRVGAGTSHTCAIHPDGSVDCWGNDLWGQSTPPPGVFVEITAGVRHSCGLRSDGHLVCWGDNSHGQTTAPVGTFIAVEAGDSHTCAIRAGGQLACWGDVDTTMSPPAGQFTDVTAAWRHDCARRSDGTVACWGYGGAITPPGAIFLAGAGSNVTLAAGVQHSCGIKANGAAVCWGGNVVAPGGAFVSVTAGTGHSCGLRPDGSLACWGSNNHGQCDVPAP